MPAIDPKKLKLSTTVADRRKMAEKYADEGVTFRPRESRDRLKELEERFDTAGIAGVKDRKNSGLLVGIFGGKPKPKSYSKAYDIGTSLNPESSSGGRKKGKGGLSLLK